MTNPKPTPLPEEAEKEAEERPFSERALEHFSENVREVLAEKEARELAEAKYGKRMDDISVIQREAFLVGRASVKASPSQAAPQEEDDFNERLLKAYNETVAEHNALTAELTKVKRANEQISMEFSRVADEFDKAEADLTTLRARAEKLAGALEDIEKVGSVGATNPVFRDIARCARAALGEWRKPAQPGAEGEKRG